MGWNGTEWGTEWDGMGWNGMEWDGMGWNGMEWRWNGNGMEVDRTLENSIRAAPIYPCVQKNLSFNKFYLPALGIEPRPLR